MRLAHLLLLKLTIYKEYAHADLCEGYLGTNYMGTCLDYYKDYKDCATTLLFHSSNPTTIATISTTIVTSTHLVAEESAIK